MVLEVVVAQLSGEIEDMGVCARPDRPGCGECADEIKGVATVVAEDASGQEFTEGGTGCRERAGCEVILVAYEVYPV